MNVLITKVHYCGSEQRYPASVYMAATSAPLAPREGVAYVVGRAKRQIAAQCLAVNNAS